MERWIRPAFKEGGYKFARGARETAEEAGYNSPAFLASNENPYPPSPSAIRRGEEALALANRYPDEATGGLVAALKERFNDLAVVTGVGMDGVIETIVRTLIEPGRNVAVSTPTFSFYRLATEAQGGRVIPVAREKDFSVDPARFLREGKGAALGILCTPNNPTGTVTPPADVAAILDEWEGLLFLDNAYVEFSETDYLPLMKKYDNLIIGRTFSKAWGLAGMRVGYAFVPEWFEPFYTRAATPFALSTVSAAAAEGALSDPGYQERYIAHVRLWRENFIAECPFPVLSSGANFVLVDVAPNTGDEAVAALARRGVVVRSAAGFPGLANHYIRVSIGTEEECRLFLAEAAGL